MLVVVAAVCLPEGSADQVDLEAAAMLDQLELTV
jgi:hypothetical protein